MQTPRTSLGYYSFSKENLKRLYGYKFKPLDPEDPVLKEKIRAIHAQHRQDEIDVSPDKIDNNAWEKFDHEGFTIYDHGKPNIKKFLKDVSYEQVGWMEQLLEDYYRKPCQKEFLPWKHIVLHPGWVRYAHTDYSKPQLDIPPQELVYVLDTETFVQHTVTEYDLTRFAPPVIATATSDHAHYIWLHPQLITGVPEGEQMRIELVPLQEKRSIVLYWNSAHDVPRIANSYDYDSQIHAIDLMSLHITRSGYSSDQRAIKGSLLKQEKPQLPVWSRVGSENNLVQAYNFHCGKVRKQISQEDKAIRKFFVKMTSLQELKDNLEEMLVYAQHDSQYTYELSKPVLKSYLGAQGCLVSLACHSDLALSKFQVDPEEWEGFFQHSEKTYHDLLQEQSDILDRIAHGILEDYDNDFITEEVIKEDLYYSKWDWRSKGREQKKENKYYDAIDPIGQVVLRELLLPEKMKVKDFLAELQFSNPGICKLKLARKEQYTVSTPGFGIPRWIFPLVKNGTLGLTNKSVLAHELLRMTYKGSPIVYDKNKKFMNLKGEQLPHKKGVGKNVGCVLSKDFTKLFKEGIIDSECYHDELARIFEIAETIAYWTSTRSRVAEYYEHNGTMLCSFIPNQTISQRGASTLLSTVPDPKPKKLGSDVKTLMHPRKGYTFVGVDFSQQEAKIFAYLGSAMRGIENSCSFSHAICVGSKDVKPATDYHSMTAKLAGIPRKVAKLINFGLIYGAGLKTTADTIQLGNPGMSRAEAESIAQGLLDRIKGVKVYQEDGSVTFKDGVGSDCFNKNTEVGGNLIQNFLVTGTEYPLTMQVRHTGKDFILTRNNMVVQSCGRALLEVVMVLTKFWAEKINLPIRLVCTIHDAFVYECPKARYLELTGILQMAHIYCWAMLKHDLGIPEMALSGAFFEGFEVGPFLRKAHDAPTVTPYKPDPIEDHTLVTMWESIAEAQRLFAKGKIGEDPVWD